MTAPRFDKVAVVGVGLIGGSLGLALKERGLARQVAAWARTPATRRRAVDRGAADLAPDDLAACVAGAELVYVSTPVAAIAPTLAAIAPHVAPGAVVTDAGSSKAAIVAAAAALPYSARFVGGHPMAGSAEAGVDAARADLFGGMSYVLTPVPGTAPDAVETVRELAEAIGARVYLVSPTDHDQAVATISHLPHLLAWALVHLTQHRHDAGEPVFELTAGSWASATRVAAGSAGLWREILVSNRAAVLAAVDGFAAELDALRELLAAGEDDLLEQALSAARTIKQAHPGRPGQ